MKEVLIFIALLAIVWIVWKDVLFIYYINGKEAGNVQGKRQHFILTIQCMLFILLPMYINMIFNLMNSHESEEEDVGSSLKCTINNYTKQEILSQSKVCSVKECNNNEVLCAKN